MKKPGFQFSDISFENTTQYTLDQIFKSDSTFYTNLKTEKLFKLASFIKANPNIKETLLFSDIQEGKFNIYYNNEKQEIPQNISESKLIILLKKFNLSQTQINHLFLNYSQQVKKITENILINIFLNAGLLSEFLSVKYEMHINRDIIEIKVIITDPIFALNTKGNLDQTISSKYHGLYISSCTLDISNTNSSFKFKTFETSNDQISQFIKSNKKIDFKLILNEKTNSLILSLNGKYFDYIIDKISNARNGNKNNLAFEKGRLFNDGDFNFFPNYFKEEFNYYLKLNKSNANISQYAEWIKRLLKECITYFNGTHKLIQRSILIEVNKLIPSQDLKLKSIDELDMYLPKNDIFNGYWTLLIEMYDKIVKGHYKNPKNPQNFLELEACYHSQLGNTIAGAFSNLFVNKVIAAKMQHDFNFVEHILTNESILNLLVEYRQKLALWSYKPMKDFLSSTLPNEKVPLRYHNLTDETIAIEKEQYDEKIKQLIETINNDYGITKNPSRSANFKDSSQIFAKLVFDILSKSSASVFKNEAEILLKYHNMNNPDKDSIILAKKTIVDLVNKITQKSYNCYEEIENIDQKEFEKILAAALTSHIQLSSQNKKSENVDKNSQSTNQSFAKPITSNDHSSFAKTISTFNAAEKKLEDTSKTTSHANIKTITSLPPNQSTPINKTSTQSNNFAQAKAFFEKQQNVNLKTPPKPNPAPSLNKESLDPNGIQPPT